MIEAKVEMLEFQQLGDERGQLVVVEGAKDIPFEIKRIFIFMAQIQGLYGDNMRISEQNLF